MAGIKWKGMSPDEERAVDEAEEWENRLFAKYPKLFSYRGTRSWCSFDSPTGWRPIVEQACAALAEFEDVRLAQVKEKFGGLRVYYDGNVSDRAREIVHSIEEQSFKTCEECGAPGKLSHVNYWSRTVCDEHLAAWKARDEQRRTARERSLATDPTGRYKR